MAGFFEALAETDEGNPRWDNLVAGLAVLRVVESAVAGPETGAGVLHDRARQYVTRVADTALRRMLTTILGLATPIVRDDPHEIETVAGRLMSYGLWLHAAGCFAPAADVFAAAESLTAREPETAMQAIYNRAFALRCLQRFDDATTAYEHLRATATRHADAATATLMGLEAELGLAKVLIDRGNLPAAETAVTAVRARAESLGVTVIVAKSLVDLAAIAGIRRDPARVIRYATDALAYAKDTQRRERLFLNMAQAFRELGRAEAAVRLAEHIAGQSGLAEHRVHAQLLLYHLAIDAADWSHADAYRSALAGVHMSPRIGAEYYEAVARHHATVGATGAALVMLQRMLAVAEEERLAELIIRAEHGLADVRRGIVPSLYDFRPLKRIPKKDQTVVAEAERVLDELMAGANG